MTTIHRCEHGDIPAACLDCLEERPAGPAEPPGPPAAPIGTFTARFPGHCQGCNLAIHEGQRISRMTDDTYRHEGC